ncbi:MAG: hypothetical protein LBD96_05245 [Treponema sp.]|nr:hypothetical protein [Treponema sp.]
MKTGYRGSLVLVFGFIAAVSLCHAEELRVVPSGALEISQGAPFHVSIPYNGAVLVFLGDDGRFFRGVELECVAPVEWLSYPDSLALSVYTDLSPPVDPAVPSVTTGRRFFYGTLPGKLRAVYQIPLSGDHNLETTPYAQVLSGHVPPASFPILIQLVPLTREAKAGLEKMDFQVSARPILGDEGAVRINFQYPEHLPDRPFSVLIDDKTVETPVDILLKEGEHRLLILSDDYRNENRLFRVERARILDLDIVLEDTAPLLFFEAPEQAVIFLDDLALEGMRGPIPVEPGFHEVRFQVSDYSIARNIQVRRGKTYRIAITVDVDVSESE